MKLKGAMALVLSTVIGMCCLSSCSNGDSSSNGKKPKDEVKQIRDVSSWDLVKEMRYGWNLGNTMDAVSEGLKAETSWQSVKTTKEMVNFLKESGFNVLRIPVTWGPHMDENYKVDAQWMARVKEIVDYGIDNDIYVILNTHHEEWYMPNEENKAQDIEQLKALWKQIAEEFKGYDEHLLFEGLNEPRLRGTNKEWTGGDDASRAIVQEYAQAFYDTVRASGGNNGKRHLLVTGYAASSQKNCMEAIDFSKFDDKVIASVHAYLPYSFALDIKGTDKFDLATDTAPIDSLFNDINQVFISKNIPVIIGEYGSVNKENLQDRIDCVTYYLQAAKKDGVPCIWWDNGAIVGNGENFGLMDRNLPPSWKFPEIVDAIKDVYNS